MLANLSLAEIDQLLDELDALARSSATRQRFFDAALERLGFLLGTSGAAIVMRTNARQWVVVAQLGESSQEACSQLLQRATAELDLVDSTDLRRLAVPIGAPAGRAALSSTWPLNDGWQRGALWVEFTDAPMQSEYADVVRIVQAFAEILSIRQSAEIEAIVDGKWMGFQRSLVSLAASKSVSEAAMMIVNDLAGLTCADRVALVQAEGLGRGKALAISGVAQFEHRALQVVAIEGICEKAIQQRTPIASHAKWNAPQFVLSRATSTLVAHAHPTSALAGHSAEREAAEQAATSEPAVAVVSTGFANHVCLPLVTQSGDAAQCDTALLFEWENYDDFLGGCATLNYIMPAFASVWQQQQRWLRIPKLQRALAEQPRFQVFGRWRARTIRRALVAAACVAVLGALCLPTRLWVEAKGTLQPLEQRVVHAEHDGVVDAILVKDGQLVETGQPLIRLRSASLEIDIQDVVGGLDANAKKQDGLNVAISRINRNDPGAATLQSRLSAEVSELVTQRTTLEMKLKALRAHQDSLLIKAPMNGMVVARHLERFLNDRPVRSGEGLMRVVRLDGPWQLELLIPDRDSGYVKRRIFNAQAPSYGLVSDENPISVDFVLASQPDVRRSAQVTWVSESARNATGEGMMVDVWALADQETAAAAHMGATVYANFDCGRAPFWFVWSRPFVEGIQSRIWF